MTRPRRDPTDVQNDVREIDKFVTAMKVFALHGRANGLDREECAALLMLVILMTDPVSRLWKDNGLGGEL